MTKRWYRILRRKYRISRKTAGMCTVFAGMLSGGLAGLLAGYLPAFQKNQLSFAALGLMAGFILTGVSLLNVNE